MQMQILFYIICEAKRVQHMTDYNNNTLMHGYSGMWVLYFRFLRPDHGFYMILPLIQTYVDIIPTYNRPIIWFSAVVFFRMLDPCGV